MAARFAQLWIIPAVAALVGAALVTSPSPLDQVVFTAMAYPLLHLASRLVHRKVKQQPRQWLVLLLVNAGILPLLGLLWLGLAMVLGWL